MKRRLVALVRGLRSMGSVVLIGLFFLLCGSPVLRLYVVPVCWLLAARRPAVISWYMRWVSGGIVTILSWGGARFTRSGTLPTGDGNVIVMNHQGLPDIVQVSLMSQPYVPAFVTRRRYEWFIPLVSQSIRLLHCPIVDPKRDPRAAVAAVAEGARTQSHGLLIFPEGHRTRNGEVGPFRTAGLQAILTTRRTPVCLAVGDGIWQARRFVDLLFGVYKIDAHAEVIGPVDVPEDPTEIPAFVNRCREAIAARLAELRARGASRDRVTEAVRSAVV